MSDASKQQRSTTTDCHEDRLLAARIAVQYALTSRAGLPAANTLRRWAQAALLAQYADAELTIRLVDVLGDVLICVTVAAQEASQQHKTLAAHLAHLLVHGVLHLQGYDHQQDQQADIMEAQERRILATLGVADPYTEA
jgi:probable rRNA maturation factor